MTQSEIKDKLKDMTADQLIDLALDNSDNIEDCKLLAELHRMPQTSAVKLLLSRLAQERLNTEQCQRVLDRM